MLVERINSSLSCAKCQLPEQLEHLMQTQVLGLAYRRGKCFKLEEIAELGCVRQLVL